MGTLSVAPGVVEAIIEHCRREYPREACGIVSGTAGRAHRVYPLANVSEEPMRRYLIDPDEQRAALEEMQRAGEAPMAIFHSHPRTPAYPSDTDIQLAYHPDLVYVIVSLAVEPPEVQGFHIDRKTRRVSPVTLRIAAD